MNGSQRTTSPVPGRRTVRQALAAALFIANAFWLAGCGGDDDSGVTCNLGNPARLAESSWPKFRRDAANTGFLPDLDLSGKTGERTARWVFPPLDEDAKGPFSASPVLSEATSPAEQRVYIGSGDGTFYALNATTGMPVADFTFSVLPAPLGSTAVAAVRDEADALFFVAGDGKMHGIDETGAAQAQVWPFELDVAGTAAPALAGNGILYAGTFGGAFVGVCPNGAGRFAVSLSPVLAPAAVGPEGLIYFATDRGDVYAVRDTGTFQWTFPVSGPVLAAPVLETQGDQTVAVYVADAVGRLSKVDGNGRPVAGFDFSNQDGAPDNCPRPPLARIASSPALTDARLYFGSDDGFLYAVDKDSGRMEWCFATGGAVQSSPAVARAPQGAEVIVVGSNDGTVYFVAQDGTLQGTFVLPDTAAPARAVRSSPAIGADGTVYIGADDGRVYALD